MTTKYVVYNAVTGENDFFDTKDEALQAFWVNVIDVVYSHFHNTAYTVVTQNEDGTETWFNDNSEEIKKPKTRAEIEALIEARRARLLAKSEATPVEVLP